MSSLFAQTSSSSIPTAETGKKQTFIGKKPVLKVPECNAAVDEKEWTKYEFSTEEEKIVIGGREKSDEITLFEIPIYYRKVGISTVTADQVKEAFKAPMFKYWCKRMDLNENITVTRISFAVIVFEDAKDSQQKENKKQRVKYIQLVANLYDSSKYDAWLKAYTTDTKAKMDGVIPGAVMLRDITTLVLIVIPTDTELQTVLIRRPRIAACKKSFPALPSGYLDKNGTFCGTSARLIQDKLSICLHGVNLVSLTQLAFGEFHPGFFPSAGGCNEFAHILFYRHEFMSSEKIKELKTELRREKKEREKEGEKEGEKDGEKEGQSREEEGDMRIEIIPLSELWKSTPDAKSLSALGLYSRLEQSGSLSSI